MNRTLFSFAALMTLITAINSYATSPVQSGLFALANNAEVAATNQAAMTRLKGTHKTVQSLIALGIGEFEVDDNLSTAGGDPDNKLSPVVVPGFYYTHQLNDKWFTGFSVNIPSGFGTANGDDWAGRYYSDEFALIYLAFTPSIAYKVNDNLSLGGALNFTYTYSESTTSVNNLMPEYEDGELTYESDAVAVSTSVSMLYEFNSRTRVGLIYASEGQAELEGDLEFKNLSPALEQKLTETELIDADFKVDNVIPQRVQFGTYHQFDNQHYFTFDTVWLDFSEFATGDISLNDTAIEVNESIYDDLWATSLGYAWPTGKDSWYKLGLLHVTAAIEDDKRSLSMPLDRIWGIGAGYSFSDNDARWDVNVNLYDMGDAPIDTGSSIARGRVVGKTKTPYAIALDIAYHW